MICHITRWKDLESWIPGGAEEWEAIHPLAPVEDVLTPRTERIALEGSLGDWQAITIHFDGSVVPRDRTTPFKGSMFAAYPGDLVFSKIDVRNGAIGLIPDSMSKVVVTSEYPIHRPDPKTVDSRYLALLLRTPNFLALIRRAASGTSGRKRITPDTFRQIEVPLPEPDEQRRMVAAYDKAMRKAAALDAKADALERGAQEQFEADLGLTPPPDLPKRPFQIARFCDIERWSHEGIVQDEIHRTLHHESQYSQPLLGEVATITHGCSHPPSSRKTPLEILKISAVTRGVLDPSEKKFIKDDKALRERFDLRRGDILMCRTNGTLAYVGIASLVTADMNDLIFPDKVIRVRLVSENVRAGFLCALLKTPTMRLCIESCARTAVGNYAIGSSDLAALEIITPPVSVQEEICDSLDLAQARADKLRKDATVLRTTAWNDFITGVFT